MMPVRQPNAVPNAGPGVKELTLWHWYFFLPDCAGTRTTEPCLSWEAFGQALDGCIQWAGAPSPLAPVAADPCAPEKLAGRSGALFASVPWTAADGFLRCLQARTLLDSYCIQTGCFVQGQASAETVRRLKETDWHQEDRGRSFLGEAICLTGELAEGVVEDKAQQLITPILEAWFGQPLTRVEPIELKCGLLSVSAAAQEEAWILVLRDDDEARQQVSYFLYLLFPLLLLARLKARFIMDAYERDLLPRATEQEAQLKAVLQRVGDRRSRLKNLEQISDDIARLEAPFVRTLSQMEEASQTLGANLENINRLLRDPLFKRRTLTDQLLAAPLRLSAGQVAMDLRYLNITQMRLDRAQRSIETMAEVRSGRWNRGTTILLGAFVAFEALQVFPELPLEWRLALSLLLPIGIALLMLALARQR